MKLNILGCYSATPRTFTNPTSQVLEINNLEEPPSLKIISPPSASSMMSATLSRVRSPLAFAIWLVFVVTLPDASTVVNPLSCANSKALVVAKVHSPQ